MDFTISCSPQYRKQLSQLEKAGGKAALAAKQAERIAGQLVEPSVQSSFLRNKQTKSGEKRLKNIEKYDLGSGYRLICRREGATLQLEFVGTHDKSDHWLNRNKAAAAASTGNLLDYQVEAAHEDSDAPVSSFQKTVTEDDDPYEAQLMEKIDERTLRRLFQGFYDTPN